MFFSHSAVEQIELRRLMEGCDYITLRKDNLADHALRRHPLATRKREGSAPPRHLKAHCHLPFTPTSY